MGWESSLVLAYHVPGPGLDSLHSWQRSKEGPLSFFEGNLLTILYNQIGLKEKGQMVRWAVELTGV